MRDWSLVKGKTVNGTGVLSVTALCVGPKKVDLISQGCSLSLFRLYLSIPFLFRNIRYLN